MDELGISPTEPIQQLYHEVLAKDRSERKTTVSAQYGSLSGGRWNQAFGVLLFQGDRGSGGANWSLSVLVLVSGQWLSSSFWPIRPSDSDCHGWVLQGKRWTELQPWRGFAGRLRGLGYSFNSFYQPVAGHFGELFSPRTDRRHFWSSLGCGPSLAPVY